MFLLSTASLLLEGKTREVLTLETNNTEGRAWEQWLFVMLWLKGGFVSWDSKQTLDANCGRH